MILVDQSQMPGHPLCKCLCNCENCCIGWMEMWQLCADHLKTSLHEAGLSGGRCLVCGTCRMPGTLSSTLQHALHPISALRAPGAGLLHLLGSYSVYPDIPVCLHLNSQLLVQQSTWSRAIGRLRRTSIAWSRLSCSKEGPLVFFLPCL